ncbi:MAG: endonuclease domain-containing protein, partial [Thermoanaerobaculia bacterium]
MKLPVRARDLRRSSTREERIVWRWLGDRRLRGVKFRRQHPILNFIADFYCDELKLVVEVDGPGHETTAQDVYDVRRSCDLSKLGVSIVRVRNEDVRKDPDSTAAALIAMIERLRSEREP